MTSPETPSPQVPSGEARLRQRSRRIRNLWIIGCGVAFLAGLGFGAADRTLGADLPPVVFWAGMALVTLLLLATNIWFLRGVDEMEVQDNLWAAYAGMSAHVLIAVGWPSAAARGLAPAPDVLAVLMATIFVSLIAYAGLKLRRRLG